MAGLMFMQLKINFGNQGWSETHWLSASSFDAAVTAGQTLLAARLAILPDTCVVVHGAVIQRGVPGVRRKAKTLGSFPQAGSASTSVLGATTGKPETGETAVMFRLQVSTGEWSNRYLHGIPDEVITQRALVDPVDIPAPGAPPNAPVAPAVKLTWFAALGNYLQLVWANTQYATKVGASAGTFNVFDIEKLTIEKIANHKIGLPFGASRGRAVRA